MNTLPADMHVVDWETEAIQPYPQYPPKPCGVALRWDGGQTEYLSWGHAEGNNCTFDEARRAVARAFLHPCAFHNAAFDMEVARVHMGLPWPAKWHDTMLLGFLCEPHAPSLGLKQLATMLLGERTDEKDALAEWAYTNLGVARSKAMLHIPQMPAGLVGPYAIGDVKRTFKLLELFWARANQLDLWPAYERERQLAPWLLDSERRGVPVDRVLLARWEEQLSLALPAMDSTIYSAAGAAFNLDANEEFADGLEAAGLVKAEQWDRTETGARSVALPSLRKLLPHDLFNLISYRNKAATMLRTFVSPWMLKSAADGRLHTGWSSTRNAAGNGTRTGRIASVNPNLANIPNEQKVDPIPGFAPLPILRTAMLPEEGHAWLSADYSQQELRILAHYEDEDLKRAYNMNPKLDLHQFAADMIKGRTGFAIDRKQAKTIGFAIIYGAGAEKIAEQLGVHVGDATTLREAYLMALPGVATLRGDTRRRFNLDRPIRTLGGRTYFCEPPSRGRTYAYKSLNVLIQGSAADQTKEAIIDFCSAAGNEALFNVTVYDEICASAPIDRVEKAGRLLASSMSEAMLLDVPVLVDVDVGPNWGDQRKLEI